MFTRLWVIFCVLATLACFIILIEGLANEKETKGCKVDVKVVELLDGFMAAAWLLLGVAMWKQPAERRFNKL